MSLPGFFADTALTRNVTHGPAPFRAGERARWIVPAVTPPSACQSLIDECFHSGSSRSSACKAALECVLSGPPGVAERHLLRR